MIDSKSVVHLGCDTGEAEAGPGRELELAILPHITAVSIACGGHAGDEESMREAILAAQSHDCLIGAHPSYPDRDGFGRRVISIDADSLRASLKVQLNTFARIAGACNAKVSFIKAHGALYHAIAGDVDFARWYWDCCGACIPGARNVVPLGTPAVGAFERTGVSLLVEGFCDRVYEPNGMLRSRAVAGACITDPDTAAAQAERLVRSSGCDLLCVHSDTPNSVALAAAVSERLRMLGVHPEREQ